MSQWATLLIYTLSTLFYFFKSPLDSLFGHSLSFILCCSLFWAALFFPVGLSWKATHRCAVIWITLVSSMPDVLLSLVDISAWALTPIHPHSDFMFLLLISIDAHRQIFWRKSSLLLSSALIREGCVNKGWLLRASLLFLHPATAQCCEDCGWHMIS